MQPALACKRIRQLYCGEIHGACGLLSAVPLIVWRGNKSLVRCKRYELRKMFRTASWLVYGARWFTASGFERSSQGFDPRDDEAFFLDAGLFCSGSMRLTHSRLIAAIAHSSSLALTLALGVLLPSTLLSEAPQCTCKHSNPSLANYTSHCLHGLPLSTTRRGSFLCHL